MKEVEINGKKYKLRRLKWKEKLELDRKTTKLKLLPNGQIIPEIDLETLKRELVRKSLVEAPFPVTDANLDELDFEEGELLFKEANALNSFEKKNLSDNSTETN